MANLYELNRAIADFDLEIDEETGEVLNLAGLDALEMERDAKIENIALWIKDLNAEAAMIKAEEDALAKRRKTEENKAERLKNYLSGFLAGEKFKTPKVAISYRASESVELTGEPEDLPPEFLRQKWEAKKTDIKKALKAGRMVPGAVLVEKQNIQIR